MFGNIKLETKENKKSWRHKNPLHVYSPWNVRVIAARRSEILPESIVKRPSLMQSSRLRDPPRLIVPRNCTLESISALPPVAQESIPILNYWYVIIRPTETWHNLLG